MERIETIVIGAGVIGLAAARALALQGQEVLILEAESAIGAATTARNSGVIHAGLYYPPASHKARHCVQGRRLLYHYLRERSLPHRRCGKLIVAPPAQTAKLAEIAQRAEAAGVSDLVSLPAGAIAGYEPAVTGAAALFSPSTGIVDVHELIHSYLGDAENKGATLALRSPVTGLALENGSFTVTVAGEAAMRLSCRNLVNAGGLHSQEIARLLHGLPAAAIPPRHLAKGNYFSLKGAQPFTHLVYPVPEPGGLGIHATLDLAGKTRFGPDVEWVDTLDYAVNPARAGHFYAAIRKYWPALPDGALQPDYSGIRPKTSPPGAADTDFIIQSHTTHGIPNLVNLYGMESPGLTAALSIAAEIAAILKP